MKLINLFLLTLVVTSSFAQKNKDIILRIEDDSSLVNYLKEHKINFSNSQVATLKGIGTWAEFSRAKKLTIPSAFFFNSNRELIKNKGKGTYCGAELKKIEKISKMKTDANQTLEDFLNHITILDGSEFIDNNVDVYIIIAWGKFANSQSQISLNWFSKLKNQEYLRMKIMLLNIDLQESWNVTDEQKKHLGIL